MKAAKVLLMHYLSGTNRFDVSSKGPSSGIRPTKAFARNVESVCIAQVVSRTFAAAF